MKQDWRIVNSLTQEPQGYVLNLTHRFVKIRQRDGSGTAKKLEESIADLRSDTALSGLFSATGRFLIS
jgi:hypothetical protein